MQTTDTGDALLQQILEARAAAARLGELETLRQQAAQLPALEREQQRRAQVAAALPQIDAALSAATQMVAGSQERMADWAQRFGAAYKNMEKLMEELATIQMGIDGAAPLAKRVAGLRNFVNGEQATDERFFELPVNNFAKTWEEVGGTSPKLDPLAGAGSDEGRRTRFYELIQWLTAGTLFLYQPFKSSRRYERI